MASTIVREPPPEERDDSLIIILNPDGTITVDQEILSRLMARQHTNISVIKVGEDEDADDSDDGTQINLTIEGFYSTPSSSDPSAVMDDVNPGQFLSEFGSTSVRTDHRTPIHIMEVKRQN